MDTVFSDNIISVKIVDVSENKNEEDERIIKNMEIELTAILTKKIILIRQDSRKKSLRYRIVCSYFTMKYFTKFHLWACKILFDNASTSEMFDPYILKSKGYKIIDMYMDGSNTVFKVKNI